MRSPQVEIKLSENPIDLVEQTISSIGMPYERISKDEVILYFEGSSTSYDITFSWIDYHGMLHIACVFDNYVQPPKESEIRKLLALINSKLLLGYFDYWSDSSCVIYRYSLLLCDLMPTSQQITSMLNLAVDNCENHFQAFKLVSLGGLSAEQGLKCSMFETTGTA